MHQRFESLIMIYIWQKWCRIPPGMMNRNDGLAVLKLAKRIPPGGVVVDVGSLLGMTAALWCRSRASRIVCIDPWTSEPWQQSFIDLYGEITKEAFLANVPDPRIETIQGLSPACAKDWNTPIDLWWEDSAHANPDLANNVDFWSQHVKPGGIACGHDFHLPDVKSETEKLAKRWNAPLNNYGGTVWWIERPALTN